MYRSVIFKGSGTFCLS